MKMEAEVYAERSGTVVQVNDNEVELKFSDGTRATLSLDSVEVAPAPRNKRPDIMLATTAMLQHMERKGSEAKAKLLNEDGTSLLRLNVKRPSNLSNDAEPHRYLVKANKVGGEIVTLGPFTWKQCNLQVCTRAHSL